MNENPVTIDVTPAPKPEAGQVDLQQLQTVLRANRADDDTRPAIRARQVFVDTGVCHTCKGSGER